MALEERKKEEQDGLTVLRRTLVYLLTLRRAMRVSMPSCGEKLCTNNHAVDFEEKIVSAASST